MLKVQGVDSLSNDEKRLTVAAVTLNFVTRRKLEGIVSDFLAVPEKQRVQFPAYLIGRKLLTPREVQILADYPSKRILRCPACPQEFDVSTVDPGSQFECPLCAILVTVPAITLVEDLVDPLSEVVDARRPTPPTELDFEPPVIEAMDAADLKTELEGQGYRVVKQIGRGGMGIVYLAEDIRLRRMVALKLLLSGGLATDAQAERFEREAKAVAALKHPNIVSIHSLGSFRGQKFFTMDYIDGMALDRAIAHKTINQVKAATICAEICDAVHHAHQTGVIHRDLKPANILLDADLTPFVTDFGLAKTEDPSEHITESGIALGTPHYMSPEQAAGRVSSIDHRSDIYSIGVILYEMLCGKVPFDGNRSVDIMMKVMNEDPDPPSKHCKIHPELEAICLKAMSREPGSRYDSALDMALDLRAFLSGNTVMAKPPGVVRRTVRTIRKVKVAVSLVLVAVIAATLSYYWQELFSTPVDQNITYIERLEAAMLAADEGRLTEAANTMLAASSFPDDKDINTRANILRAKLLAAFRADYDSVKDLNHKAAALVPLLQYFRDDPTTNELVGSLVVELGSNINTLYREPGRGPQAAVALLGGVTTTLGSFSDIVDGVRDDFCATLERDSTAYEVQEALDKAIECLQILSMLRPEVASYQSKISELRASQMNALIRVISSVTRKFGYGDLVMTGSLNDCSVEISNMAEEAEQLTLDTRLTTSVLLKNGYYRLLLKRTGYKDIERNIGIEADKETFVEVRPDEWVISE